MKRCIICGHSGDDGSTVCEVCGNPYIEMTEPDTRDLIPEREESWQKAEQQEVSVPEHGMPEAAESAETAREKVPERTESAEPVREELPERTESAEPVQEELSERTAAGQKSSEAGQGAPEVHTQESGSRRPRPQRAQYGQSVNPYEQGRNPYGASSDERRRAPQERRAAAPGRMAQERGAEVLQERREGAPGRRMQERREGVPGRAPQEQRAAGDLQGTMVQRRRGSREAQGQMPVRQGGYALQMMTEARRSFRSPLFILLTLLNTVFVAASLASVFLQELDYFDVIAVMKNFQIHPDILSYAEKIGSLISSLGTGTIVMNFVIKLPMILLCIGFWALILTSGTRNEKMPGIGFLLTKIVVVLKTIAASLTLLICLVLSVTFVVSAWVADTQAAKIAAIVLMAVIIVGTMMTVMYYFCLLHTIKVCRENAVWGEEFGRASAYAAVITVLIALFCVIKLLSAIVNAEMLNLVISAAEIGWLALTGIWILAYRSRMDEEKE